MARARNWRDVRAEAVAAGRVTEEGMAAERARADLQIVLEYAYRGLAAAGGGCLDDRDPDCVLCRALDAAERQVYGRLATRDERHWWRAGRWSDWLAVARFRVTPRTLRRMVRLP